MSEKTAILRKVLPEGAPTTGDLYRHISGDTYKNLRTGVSGTVEPDKAKEIFRINVAASEFLNGNGEIESLIRVLGLRIEQETW